MTDEIGKILDTLAQGDVPSGLKMMGDAPIDKSAYEAKIRQALSEADKRLEGETKEFVISLLSRLLEWGGIARPGNPLLDAEEDLFDAYDQWSELDTVPSDWVIARTIVRIARQHNLDPKMLNKHSSALLKECL